MVANHFLYVFFSFDVCCNDSRENLGGALGASYPLQSNVGESGLAAKAVGEERENPPTSKTKIEFS
jgi:hypothetical protein